MDFGLLSLIPSRNDYRRASRWGAKGGVRELLTLAIPMIFSMGSQSIIQFIDRVILSWSSAEAVAAAMPAGNLILTLLFFPQGIVGYASTFIAHSNGAGRLRNVGIYLWQGLWIAVIAGVLLLIPSLFSVPLFSLFGFAPEVEVLGADYFRILSYGQLPALLGLGLSCFYSGRGKTWTIAAITGVGVTVNGVLDYLWVLGSPWNPAYGIAGAAWATVVASWLTAILFAIGVFKSKYEEKFGTRSLRALRRDPLRRLLKFGFPPGLQLVVDLGCFSWFLITIGSLGTEVLAAGNLVFQIEMLGLLPLVGVGIAGAIAVGNYQGAQRVDRSLRSVRSTLVIALLYSAVLGGIILLFPDLFLFPFRAGADPESFAPIFDLAVRLMPFVALYIFGDALINVYAGALKGAGDTAFVMWVVIFGSIPGIGIVPMVLVKVLGCGVIALWSWLITYILTLSVIFIVRFQRGKWQTIVLIEPEEEGEL